MRNGIVFRIYSKPCVWLWPDPDLEGLGNKGREVEQP